MRTVVLTGAICLATVLLATSVRADCSQLVRAVALAKEGFKANVSPDPQIFNDLYVLIADLDNETILEICDRRGAGVILELCVIF